MQSASEHYFPNQLKHLCVFCASSLPNCVNLKDATLDFAQEMIDKQINLVYGGGTRGLMGVIAKAIYEASLEVVGVIPEPLIQKEIDHDISYGRSIIVDNMHDRKFQMYCLADGFVALPGGFGTLDEIIEILTWSQLGIHTKPIGLLNCCGFFDGLLVFIENAVQCGIISRDSANRLVVSDSPKDLIGKMENYPIHSKLLEWKFKM